MASPTWKAPSSQCRLPSNLLLLGVLLAGSAALLLLISNATISLRETAAARRRREQLRLLMRRHAAARRFRKSGNQREAGNDIGVSGASVHGACTTPGGNPRNVDARVQ